MSYFFHLRRAREGQNVIVLDCYAREVNLLFERCLTVLEFLLLAQYFHVQVALVGFCIGPGFDSYTNHLFFKSDPDYFVFP